VMASVVLFAGIATPLAMRHREASPAAPVTQSAPPISDEALMSNIQNDLSAPVPDSLLPLTDSLGQATKKNSDTRRTNQ
jgi:hypothetical protein